MDIDNVKKTRGRPRKETASDKETALSKETARRVGKERKPNHMAQQIYRNNAYQNVGQDIAEGEDVNSNTKIITKNLEIFNLPEIDLHDPEAVKNRIQEYFAIEAKWGYKPTVAGLGNALNFMPRQRLWEIRSGNYRRSNMPYELPSEVADLIKKAYVYLEQNWEDYMQNGKINPVAGIFLGKNNYGYQDKTEYVLTPIQQTASDLSEKQLLERYGIDSEPDA